MAFIGNIQIRDDKSSLFFYNNVMKKLVIDNKELMLDWDRYKNESIGLDPSKLTCGSNKTAHWKCHICGYEWTTRIERKNRGAKCKNCIAKELSTAPYEDSLAALFPQIAKEWDYELNDCTPDMVYPQSNKTYNWICSKGHRWHDFASHRTERQTPCPICSGRQLLSGYNDLATTHKELLKEWDYEKNDALGIKPTNLTYGSKQEVFWKCNRGHSWKAAVYVRTSNGCGCKKCSAELKTSFPEKIIAHYIAKGFDDCVENYRDKKLKNYEIDIFIPSLNLGVEYDGSQWHKNVNNDKAKDELCESLNIKLIRIRENGCAEYDSSSIKIYIKQKNNKELKEAILQVFNYINNTFNTELSVDINIDRDGSLILSNLLTLEKKNSVADSDFISDWDWYKNKGVDPSMVPMFSNRKFWWKCSKCGYEWKTDPGHRAKGRGCARCAGQIVIPGENDLETKFPEIAKEWDYSKNKKKPSEVAAFCNTKYWWICSKCGHNWPTTVYVRTGMGCGCPECKKKILSQKSSRRVVNLDTGTEYESMKKAGEALNINPTCISNACRGVSETAGGYHWKYK